jgi:hypothetical protein
MQALGNHHFPLDLAVADGLLGDDLCLRCFVGHGLIARPCNLLIHHRPAACVLLLCLVMFSGDSPDCIFDHFDPCLDPCLNFPRLLPSQLLH